MISIIMPVYNSEAALELSIGSILNQSYKDWELILVNDGSKDNSGNICRELSKEHSNIILLEQENMGAGPARNNGLNNVAGEYVLFCDADDFLHENTLQFFSNAVETCKADLVICSYQEYNIKNKEINYLTIKKSNNRYIENKQQVREEYTNLYKNNFIQAPWAKLYKTEIIRNNNIKFKDLRRCQDIIFNLEYYNYLNTLLTIDNTGYFYQTPDKLQYLSKLPRNMFEISFFVNTTIKKQLNNWDLQTNESKVYFDTILFNDLLLYLRLIYLNIWELSKKDRDKYYRKTLKLAKEKEINNFSINGIVNNLIRKIIFTENILLIEILFYCLVKTQKFAPRIIKQYKNIQEKI